MRFRELRGLRLVLQHLLRSAALRRSELAVAGEDTAAAYNAPPHSPKFPCEVPGGAALGPLLAGGTRGRHQGAAPGAIHARASGVT